MATRFNYGPTRPGEEKPENNVVDPVQTEKGKDLRVLVKESEKGSYDSLTGAAKNCLEDALVRLQKTLALLNKGTRGLDNNVRELASTYFLCDFSAQKDLDVVIKNVHLISNGLTADVTIKTGSSIAPRNDALKDAAYGAVSSLTDFYGDGTGFKNKSNRNYHTQGPKYGEKDYGQKIWFRDIRIRSDILRNQILGPVTLLHEASHKYAGTLDYCGFNDDGCGRVEGQDGRGGVVTNALWNADSYGWFIIKVADAQDIN